MRRGLPAGLNSYLAAVVVVLAAIALRFSIDPWLGGEYLFTVSYAAVALTVWLGGYGPAILAGVLAYALDTLLFLDPHQTLSQMLDAESAFALGTYVLDCAAIITVAEVLRRAWVAARHDRDFLDLALRAANMSIFEVELDADTTRRSENAVRFYGWGGGDFGAQGWSADIHPEDRSKHADALRRARET